MHSVFASVDMILEVVTRPTIFYLLTKGVDFRSKMTPMEIPDDVRFEKFFRDKAEQALSWVLENQGRIREHIAGIMAEKPQNDNSIELEFLDKLGLSLVSTASKLDITRIVNKTVNPYFLMATTGDSLLTKALAGQ